MAHLPFTGTPCTNNYQPAPGTGLLALPQCTSTAASLRSAALATGHQAALLICLHSRAFLLVPEQLLLHTALCPPVLPPSSDRLHLSDKASFSSWDTLPWSPSAKPRPHTLRGWLRPEVLQDAPGDSSPTHLSVTSPSFRSSWHSPSSAVTPMQAEAFPGVASNTERTCRTNSRLRFGGELAVPAAWWLLRVISSSPQPCSPTF